MNKLIRVLLVALPVVVAALVVVPTPGADAVQTPQDRLVRPVPVSWTPNVVDGSVKAIVQVGNTMIVGGEFTTVEEAGSSTRYDRANILAFDATTGALSGSFRPDIDGEVMALVAAPDGRSVYVGGAFHNVDGVRTKSLARISLSDGSLVAGFDAPSMNGRVKDLRLSGGRLWVAGTFNVIGGSDQTGLATLDPATGAVDPYMQLSITGVHNGGTTQVIKIDVTPDGSRLVAIGNFTQVAGTSHEQAFILDLTGQSARLADWQTDFYTGSCSRSFDSYMRDLDISPDGSYVVISTTGAYHGHDSPCDETSRWDLDATGSGLTPAWTDYTGGDTTYAVAVTGTAVYVGGHMRWENNPYAGDRPGQGAVARPGIAALDPSNGLPYSWNPTRARGVGVFDMLATSTGLWVGSDTDRIGNWAYHGKIALLPLAGGEVVPPTSTGVLPGHVYLAGSDDGVREIGFTGTSVIDQRDLPDTGISWHQAHGATMIGGTVYYGYTDGQLYARTFDGTSFGPAEVVDGMDQLVPLDSFHADVSRIGAMFFADGRLYYTLQGDQHLYYRYFTPESKVVGGLRFTATTGVPGIDLGAATGMFLTAGKLFVAGGDGNLSRVDFADGAPVPGTATVVSGPAVDGTDWTSRALFLYAPAGGSPANQPPTARASISCEELVCTMAGDASTDPEGLLTGYHWDFGDGTSAGTADAGHTYSAPGSYPVTLTVTDAGGLTDTATQVIQVASTPPTSGIGYVDSAGTHDNAAHQTVTVPAGVSAGDALILVATRAADESVAATPPDGWTLVGRTTSKRTTSTLWQRVAEAGDAGSAVRVNYTTRVKAVLSVLAYSGTSTTAPVAAWQGAGETTRTADHTTPTAPVAHGGSWALSYWADNSSETTGWTLPGTVTARSDVCGVGGGHVCTAVADSGGPVTTAGYGGLTATADSASAKAVMWTLVLRAR